MFLALLLWSVPAQALTQRGHVFSTSFSGEEACVLSTPGGVAVNEFSERVYVVDRSGNGIDEFNSEGKCVARFETPVPSPSAIAVDNSTVESPSKGDVYVVSGESSIYKFTSTGTLVGVLSEFKGPEEKEELEEVHGVAVDLNGTLWVYQHEEGFADAWSSAKKNKFLFRRELELPNFCEAARGFAVAPFAEALYAGHVRLNIGSEQCDEEIEEGVPPVTTVAKLAASGKTLIGELDRAQSAAVAADLSIGKPATGDVYVNNVTSIAAFNSSGALIQQFGSGHLTQGEGLAVNSRSGEIYATDAHENKVDVFIPEPPGPPKVESIGSRSITPTSVQLEAQVDPTGEDTHVLFQYGTSDCVSSPSSCTDVPAPPGRDIGSGFGDQHVSVTVSGLQPATTYYFRVLATSELGTSERSGILNTMPSPVGLLPDHRAWELVSPPEKFGASIEAIGGNNSNSAPNQGPIQSSEDGNSITYFASSSIVAEPEGNRSPEASQVISQRGASAWSTQDISALDQSTEPSAD